MTSFDDRAKDWDADQTKVDRANAIGDAIIGNVPLHSSMHVLEYGCGTGILGFRLRPHVGDLTLADASDGMLQVVREKLAAKPDPRARPMKLDLILDPLPERRFDLICSAMTLHHIPDTDDVLRKFSAILRPSGYLAIADLDTEDGSFHGPDEDLHHGFDRDALGKKAGHAGLRVVRFITAYTMQKTSMGVMRTYPIFLMVAQKAPLSAA
jgi:ubiquinone/menaquinone biosynthesis C-methylase UbiE